jgi:uncharacterized iron-regulated membrane protein
MLAVAVYLVSFYVFVSIFSDGVASDARWKILVVALVSAVVLTGASTIRPPLLGLVIACLATAVVAIPGLVFWIKVTRLQALKITGSYIGFVLAYSLVIGLIFGALGVHAA